MNHTPRIMAIIVCTPQGWIYQSPVSRDSILEIQDLLGPRSPSSYLESCFVMEMSDEADELDQLFLKQPAAQHPGEEWRVGSVIHP